ncbi:MAG: hypothetical protein GY953_33105, partial [bacterium]|nr:hypothetical protein [bacterium]
MLLTRRWIALVMLLWSTPGLSRADSDFVFFESQSWETGGGKTRVTVWADGRSEILTTPDRYFELCNLEPLAGWSRRGDDFVKRDHLSRAAAMTRLEAAIEAGATTLLPVLPDYDDGEGYLVGYRVGGVTGEVV